MSSLLMILSTVLMALREIRRNAMRSVLTTLGIVIGVGAVIMLVTLGQGATDKVTADIAKMGVNMLTVVPGSERRGGASAAATPLTMDDARTIGRDIAGITAVAPSAGRGMLVVYANKNWSTTVTGVTNEYFTVRDLRLQRGRMFNDVEQQGGVPACVIGETVWNQLFGQQEPLGEPIRVGKVSCRVVGMTQPKGQNTFGMDQDDFVLMPLVAFQRRISGSRDIGAISVSAVSEAATAKVKANLFTLMRERRKIAEGAPDDFSVRDMKEIADTLSTVTTALTALLSAVAAVSLLVGGIGIMNIMLVSVTERTREIGIRMAIGARAHEVLLQFLVEAVLLSLLGGVIGMVLGLGGSYAAGRALGFPFHVMPKVVGIAFGFSAAVGVAFGFFPARRAARLNPIDALRHE
jgi:putative ABC transport system permease protein